MRIAVVCCKAKAILSIVSPSLRLPIIVPASRVRIPDEPHNILIISVQWLLCSENSIIDGLASCCKDFPCYKSHRCGTWLQVFHHYFATIFSCCFCHHLFVPICWIRWDAQHMELNGPLRMQSIGSNAFILSSLPRGLCDRSKGAEPHQSPFHK